MIARVKRNALIGFISKTDESLGWFSFSSIGFAAGIVCLWRKKIVGNIAVSIFIFLGRNFSYLTYTVCLTFSFKVVHFVTLNELHESDLLELQAGYNHIYIIL